MFENALLPISLDSFVQLLNEAGFTNHRVEDNLDRVTMDIIGNETILRCHVIIGRARNDNMARYVRFMTYSLKFDPMKEGIPLKDILEWLNKKNSDLLFGRYYYHDESDTIVFEVSMPCANGILPIDFDFMLAMATISVDKTYGEIKGLVPVIEKGKDKEEEIV